MKKIYVVLLIVFAGFVSQAQIVNIPDANFKAKLLTSSTEQIAKDLAGQWFSIDTNNDGEIQQSEAITVSYLNVNFSNISSMEGINDFINLKTLYCYNNEMSSLNLLALSNLETLSCESNQLTSLVVQGLTNLTSINCSYNSLQSVNLSGITSLNELKCYYNQLTSLDLSGANLIRLECQVNAIASLNLTNQTALQYLTCSNNMLETINLSGLVNVSYFICGNNQLIELNTDDLLNLTRLDCYNNNLTTLNLNNNTKLFNLDCSNNQLISLFIKNGKIENPLNFYNNANLQYICADEGQLSAIENSIIVFGYTNCNLNSYCSFIPGGTFYTIQGNQKYDINNDGCDSNDIIYLNFKYSVSSGIIDGTIISSESGNYSIPVQSGTHLITPVLENPSYFNISPSSASVTFPATTSPFVQDFCVTANGIKNDVEVIIIPTISARPGFDAYYKIIYKNKGNQVSNGTLSLSFNDAVMDLVTALPANSSSASNSLTWNYSALNPFETREIELVFNINLPTESPAVNNGDVLSYTATIIGATDETPDDNTMTLNQTVVGSYDPNDKTCLEGNTITPSMVGKYVHYVIRFENTGTFPAENIVVTDVIDDTKFDIASLIPQSSSHSFITRINNGKVEFIFEGINLPFDDTNNDGYVAFKIKTKPTLVVGNTFTNQANIYFDYNFPITTNTASTTVALLGTQDFDFANHFSIYPNPSKDVLNIKNKEQIGVKSIAVYNTLGQMVLAFTNPKNVSSLDISQLKTGTYFIKMITDKGSTSQKFVKE